MAGTLSAGAHSGSYNGQDAYNGMLVTSGTLTASMGRNRGLGGEQEVDLIAADTLTANYANNGGLSAGNDTKLMRNIVFDTTRIMSSENRSNPQPGDPVHPISAMSHPPAITFESRISRNGRGQPSLIAPPLKAQSGGSNKGDAATLVALAPGSNPTSDLSNPRQIGGRRLTPIECERLQGFPDGWTAMHSNSVRYRQLGNAVAVPVARWIAQKIMRSIL